MMFGIVPTVEGFLIWDDGISSSIVLKYDLLHMPKTINIIT